MISIILTAHNPKKEYIDECVNSILAQTNQDFEILIMDDASEKKCASYLDEISEKDERIFVYHQKENMGVSVNRNEGIEKSKGDYVTFIDDDDYLKPEYISKMLSAAVTNSADVVICNFTQRKGNEFTANTFNTTKTLYTTPEEMEKIAATAIDPKTQDTGMTIMMLSSAWGKVYRRQFLIDNDTVRYPKGMMGGEDAVFFIKALQVSDTPRVKLVADELYVYRKTESSYTVGFQPKLPEQNLERLRQFYSLSLGHPLMEKATKRNACYAIMDMCSLYLADEKCPVADKRGFLKETLEKPEYKRALESLNQLDYGLSKKMIYSFAKHKILWPVLLAGKIYRTKR